MPYAVERWCNWMRVRVLSVTSSGVTGEELRCDAPVEVVFEDVTDDTTLYKFRRVGNLEQD